MDIEPGELTVGQLAERSGVAISALHFYERQNLIISRRTSGNQRRYKRDTAPGGDDPDRPAGRHPARPKWRRSSPCCRRTGHRPGRTGNASRECWQAELDRRIMQLEQLRDDFKDCVGCGCLSLDRCGLANPYDVLATKGRGSATAGRFGRKSLPIRAACRLSFPQVRVGPSGLGVPASRVVGMGDIKLSDDRATTAAGVIRAIAGDGARLRDDQETAVAALCEPNARVLVVQATGWGKSAVYWAATAIRRSEGAGPTLVVSPLAVVDARPGRRRRRAGLRAATLNSSNVDDWSGHRERTAVGRDRRTAGLAGAAGQPGLRPAGAGRAGRADRPAGDRRGARRLGLGARLPAGLPARVRRAAEAQPADTRCWRRPRPRTRG